MFFERKVYKKLLEWKKSNHNSAVLLEGARRVGKSTLAIEFAKREFNDYLLIDFRFVSQNIKNLFINLENLETFYSDLFLSVGKELKKGGVIIFDEIQFCPKAREHIKDFIADGRYYFIETGSLISIKENVQDIMIPSEERRINLYPLDFEEYLWAIGKKEGFNLLKEYFKKYKKIPDSSNKEYMEEYRRYLLLGGMPKVIDTFILTKSYKKAFYEQMDIIQLYREDLRKHDRSHNTICEAIFNSIPSQLAKENKSYLIYKGTGKKYYSQIRQSLLDLSDFNIINKINNLSSLDSPIGIHQQDNNFKIYFLDTGLFLNQLFNLSFSNENKVAFDFLKGETILNLGSIYESSAVQELISLGKNLYFHKFNIIYKTTKKNYELDIVFEHNFDLNILEIKSSKNFTTSSLDASKKKYKHLKPKRYVVGIKNFKTFEQHTEIPFYLLQCFYS